MSDRGDSPARSPVPAQTLHEEETDEQQPKDLGDYDVAAAADSDKDSDALSEIDEDQFDDFDPEAVRIDDRPVEIDEDAARTLKARKRKGTATKKPKEGRRLKKRTRDAAAADEDVADGEILTSKRVRKGPDDSNKEPSPEPEKEENLTPEERRRRAIERAARGDVKKVTKRRKKDEVVRVLSPACPLQLFGLGLSTHSLFTNPPPLPPLAGSRGRTRREDGRPQTPHGKGMRGRQPGARGGPTGRAQDQAATRGDVDAEPESKPGSDRGPGHELPATREVLPRAAQRRLPARLPDPARDLRRPAPPPHREGHPHVLRHRQGRPLLHQEQEARTQYQAHGRAPFGRVEQTYPQAYRRLPKTSRRDPRLRLPVRLLSSSTGTITPPDSITNRNISYTEQQNVSKPKAAAANSH